MIGEPPKFLDSPYFYSDEDGWHLRSGAPKEVQDEYDEYMKETMILCRIRKESTAFGACKSYLNVC